MSHLVVGGLCGLCIFRTSSLMVYLAAFMNNVFLFIEKVIAQRKHFRAETFHFLLWRKERKRFAYLYLFYFI